MTDASYQGRGPEIWFGTDRGAVRYRDGSFEPSLQGTVAVNTFIEDAPGVLFIGSDEGSRDTTVTPARYGRKDGMARQECNGLGRPVGLRPRAVR